MLSLKPVVGKLELEPVRRGVDCIHVKLINSGGRQMAECQRRTVLLDRPDHALVVGRLHIRDRPMPAYPYCLCFLLHKLPVDFQREIIPLSFDLIQSVNQTWDQLGQPIAAVRVKRIFRSSKL